MRFRPSHLRVRKPSPGKRRKRAPGPIYQRYQAKRRRQALLAVAGVLVLVGLVSATVYGGSRLLAMMPKMPALPAVSWEQLLPKQEEAVEPDIEAVLQANQIDGRLPGAYVPAEADMETASPFQRWKELMQTRLAFLANPSLLYEVRPDARFPLHVPGPKLLPPFRHGSDLILEEKLSTLFAQYGNLNPHLYYYNPLNRSYVSINGDVPVPAASVIKLPLLLVYLQYLDEQRLRFDTPLAYLDYHRAAGSGSLQYRPAGMELPANAVATEMIRISDNTSTNVLISALGGMETVNRRLRQLGLKDTRLRNPLPDLEGTNTISPYEMVTLLYNLEASPFLSDLARYNGLGILESTRNDRLLPAQLPSGMRIAHKTGDIGTSLGDSGIVYLPDGNRYIVSIQVERPYNDYSAKELIQQASRIIYEHNAGQAEQQQLLTNRN